MPTQIVAEIAQGFEGRPEQAILMIKAAAASKADAVKFQLVIADELSTPDYEHYELFTTLEMDTAVWQDMKTSCDQLGVELVVDIFGPASLAMAECLSLKTVKIHATDIANVPLLRALAASSIGSILLGAGGATRTEIANALDILQSKRVVLLHGFQGYPTAVEENQMSRIGVYHDLIAGRSGVEVGLSDHADPHTPLNVTLSAFALASGITVIEKHLTMGVCMELEDHEAAMNPDEFRHFVKAVRELEASVGERSDAEDFGMSRKEQNYRLKTRRHVVAARDLKVGDRIGDEDTLLKRTQSPHHISEVAEVVGKTVKQAIAANTAIRPQDLDQ